MQTNFSLDTRPARVHGVQPAANGADTEVTVEGDHMPTGEGQARAMRISEIQQQVGNGEYRVDTDAVADAILRRLLTRREQAESVRSAGPAS